MNAPLPNAQASTEGEIRLNGVTRWVGVGSTDARPVIEDCTMTMEPGKLTVLVGPSGCGKTTLINLMAGYEAPDVGEILLDGEIVRGPGQDRLVVFQESALFPWMTTWENITCGPKVGRTLGSQEIEERGNALLRTVGLADFRDKYPSQLSGGMQRRAELARAMINRPKVMFMDEPFRGLDAMTRSLMQEYYARIFEEERRTNIFVTSELDEALFLADTLIILTNSPARVKKVLTIALERPRIFSMLTSDACSVYRMEALELLHEEALRSFAQGSADAADFIQAYAAREE